MKNPDSALTTGPKEVILTTGRISKVGQIKIKKAVRPFLPWKPGDEVTFLLKYGDVVIRLTRRKVK
jgi:hypothetical protein